MLLFDGGLPAWKLARLPLDGSEAAPENFAEGEALKAMMGAKPTSQLVDLRPPDAAKQAPLKKALAATVDDVVAKAKGVQKPLLLIAEHELQARIARQRLIDAAVPADRIFVVRGGKTAVDQAALIAPPTR